MIHLYALAATITVALATIVGLLWGRRALTRIAASAAGLMILGLMTAYLLPSGTVEAGSVTTDSQKLLSRDRPVVLIGTSGLRWQDVDPETTPHLWEMLDAGAGAAGATPTTAGSNSLCASAGWLGLSSGQTVLTGSTVGSGADKEYRCADWAVEPADGTAEDADEHGTTGASGPAEVMGWSFLQSLQQRSVFRPQLGTLGDAFADSEKCATAVGPGAALVLADTSGTVSRYLTIEQALRDPVAAFSCPLTVVDAGSAPHDMPDQDDPASSVTPPGPAADNERASDVRAVDDMVSRISAAAPESAQVLSVDVGGPAPGRSSLGVAVSAPEPGEAGQYLSTPGTRWVGVFRVLDLPITLTSAAGIPAPAEFTGSPLTQSGARTADTAESVAELVSLTERDHTLRPLTGVVTTSVLFLALGAFAMITVGLPRLRQRGRVVLARRASRATAGILTVAASVPAGLFLMTTWSWWNPAATELPMWTALVGSTALVACTAALAPRNRVWAAPAIIAGITFVLLTVDAVLGTPLHRGSPLGAAPTLGGRYYGFGNPTYSVYAAAALVFAACLATLVKRRFGRVWAIIATVSVGAVTLLIDLLPQFGADVGGGLVLVPTFAVLVMGVAGARVTWQRFAVVGGSGVLLVVLIGFLDWLGPAEQRSHLGAFFQSVLDGTAMQTVLRKGGYAARSLWTDPLSWLTLAILVALGLLLWRGRTFWPRFQAGWLTRTERAWPVLRPLLTSLIVAAVGGALINDYGMRIATFELFAALPLIGLAVIGAARSTPQIKEIPSSRSVPAR